MKKMTELEYLGLPRYQQILYNIQEFILGIPGWFAGLGLLIWNFLVSCVKAVKNGVVDIVTTFIRGNWAVKLSFLIFGFGNLYYGQIMRGLLFLVFEIVFVAYMLVPSGGIYWLEKGQWFQKGATVGTVQGGNVYDPIFDTKVWQAGDDSV